MANSSDRPRVALIAGPTASGKSALALDLAKAIGGTIINADSAQVYRDLSILTARPSGAEEAQAPHRLFGHVDGADTGYSAARWAAEARGAIEDSVAAGALPILVGGTGLYMRTLLDGIAPVPEIDPAIRAEVRALPVADAHLALSREDPQAAARLNPADTTRVARALEVVRSTSRPLHEWQAHKEGGIGDHIALSAVILLPEREWLNARIDRRFGEMLDQGLDEAAALLARPDLPLDAPIRRAIGVPEAAALLEGRMSRADAEAAGALATRRYAKRQFTWFRHQPGPGWTAISETDARVRRNTIETLLRR
ncbi:tRNA (adenosine(37)-N6)-dimethylallyltransferase MiaA [Sphingomonas sp.]|uniref:tRNA (adenosine(37)-N6)-dimethylallyltransferase MiaA n=1 Tax=Sphingomonas sp. TaxID=28214 RepID=UPI0031DC6E61